MRIYRASAYHKPNQSLAATAMASAVPGVQFAVALTEGIGPPQEIMTGAQATTTGAPAWAMGRYGVQRNSYSTTAYDRFPTIFTTTIFPNWGCALFRTTGAATQEIVGQHSTSSTNPLSALSVLNTGAMLWQARGDGGNLAQTTSSQTNAADGNWHVGFGVSWSLTNHQVYIDGILGTTNSTTILSGTFDNLTVGASLRNTVTNGLNGDVAVAMLGYGVVPDPMRLYLDLISGRFPIVRPTAFAPTSSATAHFLWPGESEEIFNVLTY